MRTRARKRGASESNTPEPSATDSTIPASEEVVEKPNRISFNVTNDGLPDWERMLPKTKAQLTELLSKDSVQKALGISPSEAKEVASAGFTEDEANALLDLLGGIDGVAASKIYGVPGEITSQAFTFTADHRKRLNPNIVKVLNKWGPSIVKAWKDEIGLGIVFFSILNSQVRLMHILEEKRKRSAPAPKAATVTPISAAPAPEPEKPAEPVVISADLLETVGVQQI